MFPDMLLPVSSNCATAPWLSEEAIGNFVTPFVLEYWSSCLIIHVLLNLQVVLFIAAGVANVAY